MVSAETSKHVVRRLLDEVVNGGRTDILEELVSPDYYDHHPLPGTSPDLDGLKQRFAIRNQAFPDFQATIVQLVAEGDKVAVIMSGKGTHLGDFMGAEPTGREFTIPEAHVFRLANGRLIEHWGLTDLFSLREQLGLVAFPDYAPATA